MELGSKPIDFNLKGIDGKYYSLADFDQYQYLAIMFSCNHCPYVIASEREFVDIQKEFEPKGFTFVAINSNVSNPDYPGDSFENMIKRAEERGYNFPYLADETQEVARAYGATRTPEIYLFDKERKLVYHGRINDNPKFPDQVKSHDFRNALQALIEGKEIPLPQNTAIGCSIKFIEE